MSSMSELERTALEIVSDGRGLLAADESTGTITKRFAAHGIESSEENRRRYRELLFTADGIERALGGVILYDETVGQSTSTGKGLVALLQERGIVPGIKVDKGAKDLAGFPGEKVTEGLDGLRERFADYRDRGLRFAKWRSVINVSETLPTTTAIEVNAHGQARYAALAQEAGLVPIIEPESIMDGDHGIDRSAEVTETVLHAVFDQLVRQRVELEGVVLKTNMVVSGYAGQNQAGPDEVAERTVAVLRRAVPSAVPAIVFLSGGQDDEQATANLDAIQRTGAQPWTVSFSYARALQGRAMATWAGQEANVEQAREVFRNRTGATALANRGQWSPQAEQEQLVGL